MISGGLEEAQNHILSPYRWVLIGTGFLSFWGLFIFQPVLERLHQRIAELLGRDFHIAGGFVIFRVVITPLVIVLPVDFAGFHCLAMAIFQRE